MLKKILITVAVIVVLFVIIVVLQPSEFRVTRSITVSAPPPVVFAQVNDLHKWQAWSPWEKLDPALKRNYEGPSTGTGTTYSWAGNNQVGEGRMTITESRPHDLIRIKLDFIKPFASTCATEFTFKPVAGSLGEAAPGSATPGDRRQSDRGDVEHGRQEQLHGQGSPPFHEHR
ncbi:MAG: SRPBCC family protein [Verrucomicrobiales bacterium]